MKRVLAFISCGAVLIAAMAFFAKDVSVPAKDDDYIELQFNVIEKGDPNYHYDREAELRKEWGDELYEEALQSNPAGWIATDPVTGEKYIVDPDDLPPPKPHLPHVPEGLEVAPSPFSQKSSYANTRGEIEYPNYNMYPYCTNAFLEITFSTGKSVTASGVFIDDDLILTSGHNLFDGEFGTAHKILVTPGGVFSKFGTAQGIDFDSPNGWKLYDNPNYDYGVIRIDKSLGTGFLGAKVKTDSQLNNIELLGVYGYPGDKDFGTLWYSSGNILSFESRMFYHNAVGYAGSSGSPIVDMADYENVVGVYMGETTNGMGNIALRMKDDIIRFIDNF